MIAGLKYIQLCLPCDIFLRQAETRRAQAHLSLKFHRMLKKRRLSLPGTYVIYVLTEMWFKTQFSTSQTVKTYSKVTLCFGGKNRICATKPESTTQQWPIHETPMNKKTFQGKWSETVTLLDAYLEKGELRHFIELLWGCSKGLWFNTLRTSR